MHTVAYLVPLFINTVTELFYVDTPVRRPFLFIHSFIHSFSILLCKQVMAFPFYLQL